MLKKLGLIVSIGVLVQVLLIFIGIKVIGIYFIFVLDVCLLIRFDFWGDIDIVQLYWLNIQYFFVVVFNFNFVQKFFVIILQFMELG